MISVIIPTYNEKEAIGECVESLGFQNFTDFEIIVVDDGSSDGTFEILKNLEKTLKNFKVLSQDHKGAGAARNLGASVAKGGILVFVDADMTFDDDFLGNLVAPILEGKSKGTFSKDEYVSNWSNVWARCWNINEGWEARRRHPVNYPDKQPVFRAILKSEFEKVGGFTPGGYDDDWSLYKKLGYMATASSEAKFYHKNPESLGEIFGHAKWVAKRKYKFGLPGSLIALVRSSVIFSIIVGIYKSVSNLEPRFLIFKVIYDFGIFIGVFEYIFSKSGAK